MKREFIQFVKENLAGNFLLITTGLPATWKTETAEEVCKIKHCLMLRSDIIRLEVLKGQDIFDEKVAANMRNRLSVYDELFRQAEEGSKKSDCVILDATFITQELRKQAAGVAARHHKTLVILETSCPQEVSVQRILKRTKEKYESNALTEQAYLNNKAKFEKVDIADIKRVYPDLKIKHIVVDTCVGESKSLFVSASEEQ
jgi:predicted kinase